MAKTDQPIIIHEPGFLFAEFDTDKLSKDHKEIRKKIDKEISKAERTSRKLKEIQATCPHPREFVFNDPDSPSHQCMICGYRRKRMFGS